MVGLALEIVPNNVFHGTTEIRTYKSWRLQDEGRGGKGEGVARAAQPRGNCLDEYHHDGPFLPFPLARQSGKEKVGTAGRWG